MDYELYKIINLIRSSWQKLLGSESQLFIYGSAATCDILTARDIDVFALTNNTKNNSVIRVETLIKFPQQLIKTASLYIVPFTELLKDIIEQSCGGRWTVVGLHGIWGEDESQKNEFIARCLASVFFHYNIPENITSDEAVRFVTRVLFAHYPFYSKSAISIALSRERWESVNKLYEEARRTRSYEEMKIILSEHGKRISKREQQSRYFSSEIWSRPTNERLYDTGISSLKTKIDRTLDYVDKNSKLLDHTFGPGSTECIINGLNSISKWNVLEGDISSSVKCEYGGQNNVSIPVT